MLRFAGRRAGFSFCVSLFFRQMPSIRINFAFFAIRLPERLNWYNHGVAFSSRKTVKFFSGKSFSYTLNVIIRSLYHYPCPHS